jgi:hypothetical protein
LQARPPEAILDLDLDLDGVGKALVLKRDERFLMVEGETWEAVGRADEDNPGFQLQFILHCY